MIHKDLRLAGYLCLVLGLPFLSQIALAQGERGAISGTVTDESGAVIPGAQIGAIHVTTDIKTEVTTLESGNYYIPALPPGIYKVSAAKQGFKQTVAENVRVVVGTTVNIDLKMPVGETSQTVTVLAESPLLQTTPEVGTDVAPSEVKQWPVFLFDMQRQPADFVFNGHNLELRISFQHSVEDEFKERIGNVEQLQVHAAAVTLDSFSFLIFVVAVAR